MPIPTGIQAVEKPLTGFSDKFLQSAARTPCSPTANNSNTCSLRSIFCQVHAPTENDLILFGGLRRQTLRGFFDKLESRRNADSYGNFYMFFTEISLYFDCLPPIFAVYYEKLNERGMPNG